MKAKKVFEFHKGSNPLASLGLGPYAEWVHSIFDACGVPREDYRIEGNRTIFSRSLHLSGCTQLTELPSGLSVGSGLYLNGCTQLTELPSGLSVGWSLDLSGCTQLTELPSGLSVGDWLYLSECTRLTELPSGLSVGGWLNLNGCTSLVELPGDLKVKGNISVNEDQTELIEFIRNSKFKEKLTIW